MPNASNKARGTESISFSRVRLELAREPNNPAGNPRFGYELVIALDADGRIDADIWKKQRDGFRVVRFRPDGDRDVGHIVRRPGGSWALRYDIEGDEEQEAGFRFGSEQFVIGEYVSIRESDDEEHTYRIASIEKI